MYDAPQWHLARSALAIEYWKVNIRTAGSELGCGNFAFLQFLYFYIEVWDIC